MDVYEAKLRDPVVDMKRWKAGRVAAVDYREKKILVLYDHGRRWCDEHDVEKVNETEG